MPQQKKRRGRPVRYQQHQAGKEKKAKDAELKIGAPFEEPVPPAKMLRKRHHDCKDASKDQDRPAHKQAGFATTRSPFGVLAAAIKTAAQNCTT